MRNSAATLISLLAVVGTLLAPVASALGGAYAVNCTICPSASIKIPNGCTTVFVNSESGATIVLALNEAGVGLAYVFDIYNHPIGNTPAQIVGNGVDIVFDGAGYSLQGAGYALTWALLSAGYTITYVNCVV